ncbi:MAG: ribonuclease HII [bacterium]|nr:ribonuclease HII [bacterium]
MSFPAVPDLSLEAKYSGIVAGIDEVGRGPWAGPVMAGAFCFLTPPEKNLKSLLNDSKKLTQKRREVAYKALIKAQEHGLCVFAIGEASVQEVDTLNILQATKKAMIRAFKSLSVHPVAALVDGNQPVSLPCPIQTVIKGDQISLSIAAASIVAKVVRDQLMKELGAQHPHYGWDKNAGYGTKIHQEALNLYGVTPHHRKSFAPIARLLEANSKQVV